MKNQNNFLFIRESSHHTIRFMSHFKFQLEVLIYRHPWAKNRESDPLRPYSYPISFDQQNRSPSGQFTRLRTVNISKVLWKHLITKEIEESWLIRQRLCQLHVQIPFPWHIHIDVCVIWRRKALLSSIPCNSQTTLLLFFSLAPSFLLFHTPPSQNPIKQLGDML